MIGEPTPGIVLRRDPEIGFGSLLVLRMEVAEEWHAPPAAGARTEAFADKRCHWGLFPFEVTTDFPEGDVETKADLVVGMHGGW